MDTNRRLELAQSQLDRILAFFPRADAKASVLLAVNTGMLAILVANAPSVHSWSWPTFIVLLPLLLTARSLLHLYQGAAPQLDGGHQSLIYFREIARRTETQYQLAYCELSEEDYLNELLSQVWRNSEILNTKFRHINKAFSWLAWSIAPWAAALAVFVLSNNARLLI